MKHEEALLKLELARRARVECERARDYLWFDEGIMLARRSLRLCLDAAADPGLEVSAVQTYAEARQVESWLRRYKGDLPGERWAARAALNVSKSVNPSTQGQDRVLAVAQATSKVRLLEVGKSQRIPVADDFRKLAEELAETDLLVPHALVCRYELISLAVALGSQEFIRDQIREAEAVVNRVDDERRHRSFLYWESRAQVQLQDVALAEQLFHDSLEIGGRRHPRRELIEDHNLARLMIARGDEADAFIWLESVIQRSKEVGWLEKAREAESDRHRLV